MNGVNKVIIVGRLFKDPVIKYTPNSLAICDLGVVTSEKYKDKETSEFHRVTVFGKPAESANQYLKKGSTVYVEGKIKTDSYEKNGEKRYSTSIIANSVQFIDSVKGDSKPTSAQRMKKEYKPQVSPDFATDDIPFAKIPDYEF